MMLAYGNSLEQLWKVLERAVVWQTVRMELRNLGPGIAVLLCVILFVWKAYPVIKARARRNAGKSRTRR